MTKKQAYKIIKKQYGDYESGDYIPTLCLSIPSELEKDWNKYWDEINTESQAYVSCSFPDEWFDGKDEIISLTRLMLLHDFIEDTYE